jgi:hypothetical protein
MDPLNAASVCCAKRAELHSAAAAANISSRGSKEQNDLIEYLKENGLGNRSSHGGFLKSQKTRLGNSVKFWDPLLLKRSGS